MDEVTAVYSGPRIGVIADADGQSRIRAAFSWSLAANNYEMTRYVNMLSHAEAMEAIVAAARLAAALGRRRGAALAEQIEASKAAAVARAILTPDALPDGVDGFPVDGVHTRAVMG